MEQDKKIELLWDLVNQPGWDLIVEDADNRVKAITEQVTRFELTPFQLGLAQGIIQVQRQLIAYRNTLETILANKQENDVETDTE